MLYWKERTKFSLFTTSIIAKEETPVESAKMLQGTIS